MAQLYLNDELKYDNSPLSYTFVFYTFVKSINSIISKGGDTIYDIRQGNLTEF